MGVDHPIPDWNWEVVSCGESGCGPAPNGILEKEEKGVLADDHYSVRTLRMVNG
jgi:hypothetical protein